jgi:sugar lactone lactonase YvrE
MRIIRKAIYTAFTVLILAMSTFKVHGASGDLFASVNGTGGNGGGFIYRYTPNGAPSIFASGLSRPRGLAFDSVGDLFVATTFCDARCHSTILKITPSGAQNVFATIPSSFFAEGVAIDESDNVFVMAIELNNFRSIIFKFDSSGSPRVFGVVQGEGFGLTFDSAGNLFAADHTTGAIYEFAPDGKRRTFVDKSAFPGFSGPVGLTIDDSDNLFASTTGTFPPLALENAILEFTPSGAETTFVTGLNFPSGLVFDTSRNLFIAENPLDSLGDILKVRPDSTTTLFASGIGIQASGGPDFLIIQP